MGFWWQPRTVKSDERAYIQLEQERLCFRVDAADCDGDARQQLKWEWHERFMDLNIELVSKPNHMRVGASMAVAEWSDDWLSYGVDGTLDLDVTVETLREAERVLVAATGNRAAS